MKRVVMCLAIFVLLVPVVRAQVSTGTILGVVKDSSGAVVPGAKITALQTDTGQTRNTVTGGDGAYRLDALPIGNYRMTAEAQGFQTEVQSGLTLSVAQEAVSNFTLPVGATSQTVTVTTAAPLINVTTASISSLVDPQEIITLPLNGRNYNDLTLLQVGVTRSTASDTGGTVGYSGTLFSSDGAPAHSNTYLMDGGLMVNGYETSGASAIGTTLGVDGIAEYRVITNNIPAEYGETVGSQMIVVSKSGTNAFHGDAFEFLRNSVLDARNYFDLPAYSTFLNGHRNPEFRRNQYGGSLGGPIQNNKTFFFVVYEGLRSSLGVPQLSTVPGTTSNPKGCQGSVGSTITLANCPQLGQASAVISDPYMLPYLSAFPAPDLPGTANNYSWVFPQVTSEDYGQIRIDHTFSARDNIFGRYTIDQAGIPYPGVYNESEALEASRDQFYSMAWNHIFSGAVVNSARFAFTRMPDLITATREDPLFFQSDYVQVPGNDQGASSMTAGITSTPGISAVNRGNVENIFTVGDDLSYNRGRHSFKFGFVVNHYATKYITHGFDRGVISFATLGDFMAGMTSFFATVIPPNDDITKYLDWDTMGFYAQDSWAATKRLTLNYGMRYEPVSNVDEVHGHASNYRTTGFVLGNPGADISPTIGNPVYKNETLRNWSPRFGFAWDVFGDEKTAVRGGFDLLYDLSTLGGAYLAYAEFDVPFAVSIITSNYNETFGALQTPAVLPNLSSFTPTYKGPVWNMAQPHMMSWNLSIERELPGNMGLTVAYVGTKGLDLLRSLDGNVVLPSGIPAVDSAGQTICALQPYGTVLNNTSQYDGSATSCYAYNTTTLPQCGYLAGNGVTPPQPGGSVPCYNRENDGLPSTVATAASATSFYNALQVNLSKRVSSGLQFNAAYTWSKLMDNDEYNIIEDGQIVIEEPLHPNTSMWGPAIYDATHNFRLSAIYQFPKFASSKGFARKVLNGWETSGILSLQTGYPFDVGLSSDRSNIAYAPEWGQTGDLPDIVPGRSPYSITHGVSSGCGTPGASGYIAPGTPLGTPKHFYDPCAFSTPAAGFIGNETRGVLRGPNLANLDFSIVKDTPVSKLGEGGMIEFRAEVFDLFNHPSFPLPGLTVAAGTCPAVSGDPNAPVEGCAITPNPGAGSITSTIDGVGGTPGGQRQIQFALKLIF
jgi:hypothetical protein